MSDRHDEQQRIIDVSMQRPYSFEQGSSLHLIILGMAIRPSGPHDEDPFLRGYWSEGRSRGELDLRQLQGEEEVPPEMSLWFDDDRIALDISATFQGVPADAVADSGIPPAVLKGPVAIDRRGDAADGIVAMLTQLFAGRIVIHPHGLLDVLASEHLTDFQEHQTEGSASLRTFNAVMSMQPFLDVVGLSRTMLVNQMAIFGCDLRFEVGVAAIDALDAYLESTSVQLAWLVDESYGVHTAQAVITLTDFLADVFTSDAVVAQLAKEEGLSIAEMSEFLEQAPEAGRLGSINAFWQKFVFEEDDTKTAASSPVQWPDAVDLTAAFAAQAVRRSNAAHAAASADRPAS